MIGRFVPHSPTPATGDEIRSLPGVHYAPLAYCREPLALLGDRIGGVAAAVQMDQHAMLRQFPVQPNRAHPGYRSLLNGVLASHTNWRQRSPQALVHP